jgi:alginate O-acetyltransferase complex protein AlgI
MLFPQLIAGPIIRYKDIHNQLPQRNVTVEDVNDGLHRFAIGLAKKVLIADSLGQIADPGFGSPASELAAADAWLALVCYTLQIYFDFSGYSDMAIGLARLFGFRFPENFNYPYTARSVQDFWRRWHISLSRWFRDYLYVPLGGNRAGRLRTVRNLWIVFLLAGLWHGADWKFVIWGALHGLFLTLERAGAPPLFRGLRPPPILAHAYTLLVVMTAWVFFRATSFGEAIDFLLALVGHWPATVVRSQVNPVFIAVAVALAMGAYPRLRAWAGPVWKYARDKGAEGLLRSLFIAPLLVACMMFLSVSKYNPFIYFRF